MINEELIKQIQYDFEINKYVVIKEFLKPHMANLAYSYCKTVVGRINFMTTYSPQDHRKDWDGDFGDAQAANCYSNYADPLMECFLLTALDEIKLYTGINLAPQYSYWRLYQKDNELVKHIDRNSCEISATLCLGYDVSNLESQYNWPIFIEDTSGQPIEISLNPGDMIIYKGCELQHWREKFKGLNHAQVFLHYTNKDGETYNEYDGRPMIGIPKRFTL